MNDHNRCNDVRGRGRDRGAAVTLPVSTIPPVIAYSRIVATAIKKLHGFQTMSVENMVSKGVTNQRHLRYGASTLIRDKIYPADLRFYRRQIVREDIPRPEVPDVPTTTAVINDLLDYTKQINLKQEANEQQMLKAFSALISVIAIPVPVSNTSSSSSFNEEKLMVLLVV